MTGDSGHRPDFGIRGAWQPQVERALFDIKVVDTDAPSHYFSEIVMDS